MFLRIWGPCDGDYHCWEHGELKCAVAVVVVAPVVVVLAAAVVAVVVVVGAAVDVVVVAVAALAPASVFAAYSVHFGIAPVPTNPFHQQQQSQQL